MADRSRLLPHDRRRDCCSVGPWLSDEQPPPLASNAHGWACWHISVIPSRSNVEQARTNRGLRRAQPRTCSVRHMDNLRTSGFKQDAGLQLGAPLVGEDEIAVHPEGSAGDKALGSAFDSCYSRWAETCGA